MRPSSLRCRLLAGLAVSVLAAVAATAPSAAAAQTSAQIQPVVFDIEGGSLDAALIAFAQQSGRQLIYSQSLVQGLRSNGLKGRFTPDEAISRLLGDAAVLVERSPFNGFVLKRRPQPIAFSADGTLAMQGVENAESAPSQDVVKVAEVVVTGSLIRGAAAGASPLVIVSREEIDRSGRATVAEVLTDLPQAFGGQNSPDATLSNSDRSGNNNAVATGVNLRGLGAAATLVLVNGRRMAGTGFKGDFADVSALPTAAIDRVEVLLDGSSAIYGSDAVGGVVNIILKRNFEGQETRTRLGGAQGGAFERQLAHTAGFNWSTGNLLASYEYYTRNTLPSEARAFTGNADLRGFGGADRRLTYSHPGNIVVLTGGVYVPTWAIPSGQNGVGLTASSFQSGTVNFENQRAGSDILPDQTRNSGYLAFNQRLGSLLQISGDARISRRDFAYAQPGAIANLSVTRANPYFVSPNGSASHVIAYAFADELGPLRSKGRSDNLAASLGADLEISSSWRASAYAAYAEDVSRRDNTGRPNSRFLSEALGAIPDDPATPFSASRDGFFNPFGDGGANSKAVLDFIGSGYINSRFASTARTFNAQADGTLFRLPAGDVKLALGVQQRRERFETRTIAMTSRSTPTTTPSGPYERTVKAAFAELRAPLVGPANALPLVQRLEASIAARVESFDDVGSSSNPKVGVVWSPAKPLTLRASYGRSFRAPSLPEVFDTQDGGPAVLPQGALSRLVLLRYGGNTGLQPETAKSWTAGADYVSSRWSGLRLSATWFDTRFSNQIGTPVYDNIYNVLGNAAYSAFVQTIDPNNPADLAKVDAVLAGTTSAGLYPANAYNAIVDGRNLNTGGLDVRGLDLSVRHRIALAGGAVDLSADATKLLRYRRMLIPGASWLSLLDTDGQPIDLRTRATAAWSRGAWSVAGSVNYADNYASTKGVTVDSWTTLDSQVTWRSDGGGLTDGVMMAFSVRNLFDKAPPFFDSPQGVAYDPANADPLGRFVSVQLTKRW